MGKRKHWNEGNSETRPPSGESVPGISRKGLVFLFQHSLSSEPPQGVEKPRSLLHIGLSKGPVARKQKRAGKRGTPTGQREGASAGESEHWHRKTRVLEGQSLSFLTWKMGLMILTHLQGWQSM